VVDGAGPIFRASPAQPLFKVRVPTRGLLSQYQPSDDGQRLLVNTLSEQAQTPRTLTVVLNWPSLVKKRETGRVAETPSSPQSFQTGS